MLTHLSLFSGVGGFDLAADAAGFTTVCFCEIEPFCQQVLKKHWPHVPIISDVRQVTTDALQAFGITSVDLLSGGPPCQPASLAGKRQGRADERWLWDEWARVIREVEPRWIVAENPSGILSVDAGRGFGGILRNLAAVGYDAVWCMYGANDVGAPHKRDRAFIVAYPDNRRRQQYYPKEWFRQKPVFMPMSGSLQPSSGAAEPKLGGDSDGISAWLDGSRWPAGPQEAQYEFEPPRVATGVPNRVARLKALGNAVVPAQIYPILKTIAECSRGKGD